LAIGVTCCLLMLLFVRHELSYDRFHEAADRIHRVVLINDNPQTRTPHPMAQALVRDIPEVESAVSLTPIWGPGLTRPTYSIRYEDRQFEERDLLAVDSTFFEVFDFPVVAGNGPAALREPFAVVITESMAKKYFGDDDPLGKRLRINDEGDLTVRAVLQDVPANAHFHFDFLLSYVTLKQLWQGSPFFEWGDFGHYNYVRLTENATPDAVEAKIPQWIQRYVDFSSEEVAALEAGTLALRLQPITDIHLHSDLRWELEPNGNLAYVYIFGAAALFILLIACVNFMNLATARSASRAREVGVRKAVGANRTQLAGQFLSESLLFSLLAVLCALLLTQLTLPLFNRLAGTDLSLSTLGLGTLTLGLLAVALVTGLVAGSYPAVFLSSFQPVRVLRGTLRQASSGVGLRKGLVVFQFALSIILIVGTLVIQDQLHFLRNQRLGFDDEQVIVLPLNGDDLRERTETLKEALLQHGDVLSASAVSNVPGGRFNQNSIQWHASDEPVDVSELRVDFDFFETLGIDLADGRSFSRAFPSDTGRAVVLNETAARLYDWDSPVGEDIRWFDDDTTYVASVIGVAQDFHFASLHERIAPLAIQVLPGEYTSLLVKIRPDRPAETLAFVQQTWNTFAPGRDFTYTFLDRSFDALYAAEAQTGTVIALFSGLAILIACLGLFGLATFAAERRTKEIGIRKVLGASVSGLLLLLSKEFVRLVLVALVIAAPLAYLGATYWLDGFAYRTALSPRTFVVAGFLTLLIALATVSYHAVRTALADPVESLRYE
jgi:putative ABC transport system permease protein